MFDEDNEPQSYSEPIIRNGKVVGITQSFTVIGKCLCCGYTVAVGELTRSPGSPFCSAACERKFHDDE